MVQWLERHAARGPLPVRLRERLDLCMTELVTNIISYAYPGPDRGPISLQLARSGDQVDVVIEDQGIPFDPFVDSVYKPADSLHEARPGGRGVAMIRRFADEFRYQRVDGRNRVSLTFRI